jgi:hypothetical protein
MALNRQSAMRVAGAGRVYARDAMNPNVAERFWAKVDKTPECWLWTGALSLRGNGQVRIGGKLHHAHRVAYELERGPLPERVRLGWTCDMPSCVRPDHLVIGVKLTASDVRKIRASNDSGRGAAERYGVSQQMIAKIRAGRAWKHVQ